MTKGHGKLIRQPHATGSGLSFAEKPEIRQRAKEEANIAIRLLQQLHAVLTLPESVAYQDAVGIAVEAVPDSITFEEAQWLASALRAARTRLAEDASSFPIWAKVARAVNPQGGPRKIPRRFMRRAREQEQQPLRLTREDARTSRAVKMFRGDDGNSAARNG